MRGASEGLLPILMTAVVTALGLLPLAIGSGTAGRESKARDHQHRRALHFDRA